MIRERINRVIWIINLLVLFCFVAKISDFDADDLRKWSYINLTVCIIFYRKLGFDLRSLLLFAAMSIYAVRYQRFFAIQDEWVRWTALSPGLAYLWGKFLLGTSSRRELEEKVRIVVWVIVLGMLMHGILNAWSGYKEGILISGTRRWSDYWTEKELPATQHVFFFVPIVSTVVAAFLMKWWSGAITLVLIAGSLWFNIVTGSRTIIGILGCAVIWGLVLCVYFNRKNKKFLVVMGCVVLVICVISMFALFKYFQKNGGVKESKLYFFMFERGGGIFHNVRFTVQMNVIRQMQLHYEGGKQLDLAGLNYAHNVWLDMYNAGGTIPFALFSGFCVLNTMDVIRVMRSKKISIKMKVLLTSIWLGFVEYYMIEPALDGNVLWISYWCLLGGTIRIFAEKQIEKERFLDIIRKIVRKKVRKYRRLRQKRKREEKGTEFYSSDSA